MQIVLSEEKVKNVKERLDDNQLYYLCRRAIVFFFAKTGEDMLQSLGYEFEDFYRSMRFMSNLYYDYKKGNKNAISNETSI